MKKRYIKILLLVVLACILFTGNVCHARLIGKNNNKNDWVGKINANMDSIANHFVDSVIQDKIEYDKYKEDEANEEAGHDNSKTHVATTSCASPSCATVSNIKDKY